MPRVSVLMPIYNTQESHLREAIESILAQTYGDFEFIILNDSPDNTGLDAIVTSYSDERIVYSKNKKNIGISASRNKLIDMSQGEYLAVMDHDDISLPERFAKQVSFLDEHADVGVVGTWCKGFVHGQKWNTLTQHKDLERDLFFGCSIKHPSSMLRKSVLVAHGIRYEEEYSPSEDYRLWCCLIGKTHFAVVDEELFLYRDHDTRTSCNQAKKMAQANIKIHEHVRAEYPELWMEARVDSTICRKTKIFGIPFFYTYEKANMQWCRLWDIIPLYSVKTRIHR
ncbi:MAG: glycosyltransferase family A protein [Pseudomonadota bacterium]